MKDQNNLIEEIDINEICELNEEKNQIITYIKKINNYMNMLYINNLNDNILNKNNNLEKNIQVLDDKIKEDILKEDDNKNCHYDYYSNFCLCYFDIFNFNTHEAKNEIIKNEIADEDKILCWWCSDDIKFIFSLPCKIMKNKIFVFGNFC